MKTASRNAFSILILVVALLAGTAGFSLGESLSGGYIRYYDNGTNGILNLSDGNSWVITFTGLDFDFFNGNFELLVGDRGPGSSWKKFPIRIVTDNGGPGAHLLEAYDAEFASLKSSHALTIGQGLNPIDVRMVMSQNPDDTWHIVPFVRLQSGQWTLFSGGAFDSDDAFDLTKSMLTLQFGAGASGIAYFDVPTAQAGNVLCAPDPIDFNIASPTRTATVEYAGGGSGLLYAYSVSFSWDGAVVSTDSSKVTQGTLLSSQGSTWFEVHTTGANTLTVDCTLLGSQPGVTGPGAMFNIEFTGVSCDTSTLDITIDEVVDSDNNPLTGFTEDDALLFVDTAVPVFTINGPYPDSACYNTDPVLDLSVADACSDLDDAFYKIDAGSWQSDPDLFTDYAGGSWSNASWTVPGFAGLSQGTHTVRFYCVDDFGNPSAEASWDFIKDTIDPSPASGFAAGTGHGKVHLTWANPTADFDHVVVVRKAWDDPAPLGYPEFAQPADGYPVDPADGVTVYNGTDESYDDVVTDRSIYFYRAFAYDCAGNKNGGTPPTDPLPDAFAQGDRSTNYWLGDVTQSGGGGYDGFVDFFDINALSGGYRRYSPGSPPVPPHDELDVGRTDDGSRLGVPIPDDEIEFQDLVIFAMNFNVVGPTGKDRPVVRLAGRGEAGAPVLRLDVSEDAAEDGETFALRLSLRGNDAQVKAAGVLLGYDPDRLEWVETKKSDELASARSFVFFQSGLEEPGRVWVDLAALGTGEVIHGSGELAEIVFRVKAGADVDVRFEDADLRDAEGARLYASLNDLSADAGGSIPLATRLSGARPNPFNPTTSVMFDLSRQEDVRLNVFDVKGRLVRTLVDESRSAGSHTVVWDGKDDTGHAVGSGPYFVQLRAGLYESTTKVVMLR
ncbi:MAG: FlgD immunoglobulin-like domain containing protein [Candidatus Eisenbacteria bacterium]